MMSKTTSYMWMLVLALGVVLLTGCGRTGAAKKDPNVDYYTCTMHPSVRSQDPKAKCPICSMDLIPVMKEGAGSEGAHQHGHTAMSTAGGDAGLHEFTVPVPRQQQIGVRYAAAHKESLHYTIRSVGFIVPDKAKHWEFVSRVEGYVQKLHVTSPGELVEEGQPLVTIYSPELLTTSREFVNLLEARDRAGSPEAQRSSERLIESARRRLEQWNVTTTQIAELEKSRKPSEFLTLRSPFKGVVEDVPVDQGRKVAVGEHLVDVADLSVVWVWAEFYENEVSMVKHRQKVTVTSESYPGEKFEGEVALMDPFLNQQMRTGKGRIDIPNPDFKLRPGMYVNIALAMNLGEGLTIPVSAVMPTGARNLVFVDKGEGKLEPRAVQLGRKFGDAYEVQSGVSEGERVVATANFLIDAESKVQGAVQTFEEPEPAQSTQKAVALPAEVGPIYERLFTSYLAIAKALAADDFQVMGKEGKPLRDDLAALIASKLEPTERPDEYRTRLAAFATAVNTEAPKNLEEARIYFGKISEALIALTTRFAPPLERPLVVAHCPMWEKSSADWLQAGEEIENPYMGKMMLTCGEKVRKLEGAK